MQNYYKDISCNLAVYSVYGNQEAPVDSTMKRLCQKIN